MSILWPAFLLACVTELVVFALVDPADLHWRGETLALSRQAIYTAGFFLFWLFGACANALTLLLMQPAAVINSQED
ncbi:membrane protein [Variovorax defluvii]|uniref:Membrane protein n=2 Tax=Variovorax defluvii TaxID=913761 RepID=A0ABP8IA30_9BURK